jgi:hypothetical protein
LQKFRSFCDFRRYLATVMVDSDSEIRQKYPLHYLVWNNDFQELESVLRENKVNLEFSFSPIIQLEPPEFRGLIQLFITAA